MNPPPDAIRRLEAERYEAMPRADPAKLAALLSEDIRYTHSDGSQDGKTDYIQKVEDGMYRYLSIEHGIPRRIWRGRTTIPSGSRHVKQFRACQLADTNADVNASCGSVDISYSGR